MEKEISVHTPCGELTACVGFDEENYPEIYIYLVRPDRIELGQVVVSYDLIKQEMNLTVFDNVDFDDSKTFTLSKKDLLKDFEERG